MNFGGGTLTPSLPIFPTFEVQPIYVVTGRGQVSGSSTGGFVPPSITNTTVPILGDASFVVTPWSHIDPAEASRVPKKALNCGIGGDGAFKMVGDVAGVVQMPQGIYIVAGGDPDIDLSTNGYDLSGTILGNNFHWKYVFDEPLSPGQSKVLFVYYSLQSGFGSDIIFDLSENLSTLLSLDTATIISGGPITLEAKPILYDNTLGSTVITSFTIDYIDLYGPPNPFLSRLTSTDIVRIQSGTGSNPIILNNKKGVPPLISSNSL